MSSTKNVMLLSNNNTGEPERKSSTCKVSVSMWLRDKYIIYYAPINGLPQDGGRGRGNPREFDLWSSPREGILTSKICWVRNLWGHSLGAQRWGIRLWIPKNVKFPWGSPPPSWDKPLIGALDLVATVLTGTAINAVMYSDTFSPAVKKRSYVHNICACFYTLFLPQSNSQGKVWCSQVQWTLWESGASVSHSQSAEKQPFYNI